MTAPNHAVTGALIGLTIANPWLALPLAFLSHFACDVIPHYDMPGSENERIASNRFAREMIVYGAIGCFLIVLLLFVAQPVHWLAACFGAFLAASPDLFWFPRWLRLRKGGTDNKKMNPFLRFHSSLQWKTGPKFITVEIAWFVALGWQVLARI